MKKEDVFAKSLDMHRELGGKLDIECRKKIESMEDLSLVYTPGVAEPCRAIERDPEELWNVTIKNNLVAVITDGSAVLGLGDIGPAASMPVMEGKSCLFKRFAGIDSVPLAVSTKDVDEFVNVVSKIAVSFGGINLEDISAPRCFEIERRLQERLDIPVFHDDQHGTAVIALAAYKNALRLTGRGIEDAVLVINGAGAAGSSIARYFLAAGVKNIIMCDVGGALCEGYTEGLNPAQIELSKITNPEKRRGSLAEVIRGADAFLGVSRPGLLTGEMVRSMAPNPVVFAMANPTPEIFPDEALAAGAAVVATGRSDFPNQVNNCLGFPGIFRGALDVRARCINEEMKLAASEALASLVSESELSREYIIPSALDPRVVPAVAAAVAAAARRTGVSRI
ncbi:NAD(P)-dependent malic enzyme [Cloacibacillus porcorum]|uniref:NAD(P)-dependent malic enzyme n=1 Tax=Cloacibacillus porcorum TaxID=1197717 RepID=UPI001459E077|nr:malic enzyme-like NAD(P)-binding protein [Cloacibacillus porcorum]MCC8184629.1 NAD-dependent malic enzyme [Cloacibacillus porcorum]MDD7650327.1 NAD-dependent malic enzyme [Cloacibacillus porcorum]MDY4092601.1 malic enzyme-like NAD(P)-binding protein [Cloacibacillus porcorum]MDY5391319.1 malic enzyme-like NAD(P)-binding protein [Cloacibacillus porcorum]NMF17047.1 NAD-dependent malic enzyme [Cloacibacillus porcorum]